MKRVRLVIVCGVILSLCVWCICRWDVWFGNPDEDAYVPENVPTRILLTFGDENELNRNVSWMCGSKVCKSFVELVNERDGLTRRMPAVGEVFKSRSGEAAYYVARLRQLQAGRTYRYRVGTNGRYSDWYEFRMQDADTQNVSFLYVGDVQDTIGGIANRLLKAAFRENPDVDFLVCGGDLTERPTDAYWGETFATLDSVGQTVPVLTVAGNHDYLKGVVYKLERRFALVHSQYLDSMIGENHVFTLRYKNLQLFCLDSNREFPYLWTQRQWLKEQLEESKATWKIVVLHHPLYSIRGSMNNLIQRWMFDDLIRTYGVDIVLQGHEHAYARMTHHDENGVSVPPVYTVSHCSPKNYRIEFDDRFDKFGSGSRYYQKVQTDREGNYLLLTARDAETGLLYDSLLFVKQDGTSRLLDGGKDIPEQLGFVPRRGNARDAAFVERIEAYKRKRHLVTQ